MKKFFSLLLTLFITISSLSSCNNESNAGKISLIRSNFYGTIKPIDIYEIKDGYMETVDKTNKQKLNLEKSHDYYACTYSSTKSKKILRANQKNTLKIDYTTLKITWKQIVPNTVILKPAEPYTTVYYSEYFGWKAEVEFIANISFYKTLHIKLEEKIDTYIITYYCRRDIDNYDNFSNLSFSKMSYLEQDKKIIEVPKSDIERIEYFT